MIDTAVELAAAADKLAEVFHIKSASASLRISSRAQPFSDLRDDKCTLRGSVGFYEERMTSHERRSGTKVAEMRRQRSI
jgi:hypothetical protein